MQDRSWGRIVNIASIWSKKSKKGRAAYSSSKFALYGMTLALSAEHSTDGILANCISPGFIDTEATRLNSFKMPFLKSAEFAAEKIYKGLVFKKRFEIYFPFTIVFIVIITIVTPR